MEAASLPSIVDSRSYESLVPDGLFYRTESSHEYQFMLRYVTRLLSVIDHSESALIAATRSPIESKFIQPNQDVPLPNARLQSDIRFLAELTMRCCFSLTTVVGALDYLLRLHSSGIVRLHSTSWKTVFVVCCLIGEKVWEDNYVHPSHIINQFGYLAKGGSNIPKKDYLGLQISLARALNWDTNTPSSRYRELISSTMSLSVPFAIYRHLPNGYAGFVPRPLPPLPKMNIPLRNKNVAVPIVDWKHASAGPRHTGSLIAATLASVSSTTSTSTDAGHGGTGVHSFATQTSSSYKQNHSSGNHTPFSG
jgi:hypothetical protein